MPPQSFQVTVNFTLDEPTLGRLRTLIAEVFRPVEAPELPATRTPRPALPAEPLLINMQEAAKFLKISSRTLFGMAKSGQVPQPVRLGHSVRWNVEELKAWVTAGCPEQKEWERIRR